MIEIDIYRATLESKVDPQLTGALGPHLVVKLSDYSDLATKYASAVRTLQDIAAMGKKAGSESAAHRLAQLGEPREAE